jgi:small subunit ribosomal protein S2
VVALVDTNCDPDEADFVIPGNDDAIRSCSLVIRAIADGIAAGQSAVTADEFARPSANGNGAPAQEEAAVEAPPEPATDETPEPATDEVAEAPEGETPEPAADEVAEAPEHEVLSQGEETIEPVAAEASEEEQS